MAIDGDATGQGIVAKVGLAVLSTLVAASLPVFIRPLGQAITDRHIGDPMALAAIILAVGGFGITIWQLDRTATASRAATRAVENLKFRIRGLEDSQLCHDCLAVAGEIERHHVLSTAKPSIQTFVFLPERYRTLRLFLTELRTRRKNGFSDEDQRVIQDAVAKLSDGENSVIRYLRNPVKRPNLGPLQSATQALSNMLTAVSVELNRTAMGETDDEH